MALVVADRVQQTTTTAGTGTVTLSGSVTGYQSFSAIGNGNTTYYTLVDGSNWEVGIGTYTASGTTLSRDTVYASSAGGTTKITLSGGTTNVLVTYPAEIATMLGNPTPTAGGVLYGTGTAIGVSAVGTVSGYQFLQSAGAASPTWVQIPSFKDVAVAPSSPAPIEGDRFFDNTSGINYTYITDANGSQWVETSAAGTPTNGVFSTMALGGATLGSNALAVTGTTALSSTLNFGGYAAEGTVTAAATTDLGTSTANRQSVTGSTTITSFGTGANLYRIIRFTGAPLLTYNATTLITPTKANIQAAPGDIATLTSDGSGNWTIISYAPFGGTLFTSASGLTGTGPSNIGSLSLTPGKWSLSAMYFYSGSGGSIATVGVGTTSSSLAGMVTGTSRQGGVVYTAGGFGGATLGPFIVTLTATTTYYAVYTNDGSANSDVGSFTAQRII